MERIIYACFIIGLLFSSQGYALYPKYQRYPYQKTKRAGNYALCQMHKIKKKEIKTIFEIGSRDAQDAIELSDLFRCHVFAFECNPTAIEICRKNIGSNPNVTLIPFGAWDRTGELVFHPVIGSNIGASSFFEFNPNARNYPDIVEQGLLQEEIIVPVIRLDEFLKAHEIENIDLLCMDVQGAAYQVLSGLGEQITKVKYIIVELETHPIYSGEILYEDVDRFLMNCGFIRASRPLDPNGLFGDVLYIHKTVL